MKRFSEIAICGGFTVTVSRSKKGKNGRKVAKVTIHDRNGSVFSTSEVTQKQ